MSKLGYNILPSPNDKDNMRYFFVSRGNADIIKAIDYTFVTNYDGKRVFNLAFGNYDSDSNKINDSEQSDNGDVYHVFGTVLNTIPMFFDAMGDCIMMVNGSDSTQEYLENCKKSCTKKCNDLENCRNKDRRINVYRRYVNNNYDNLSNEYSFLGGFKGENKTTLVEPYEINKQYDSVFVFKK